MQSLSHVSPCEPVAPWIGGKRRLAERLCGVIDTVPCETYAEPFVGMGGIFLRRLRRPKAEVINDISTDVTTFFRVLQRHPDALMDMLMPQLASRAEFARQMATDPDTLTDIERAARFFYLQRMTFGGKVAGRSFGTSKADSARFDMNTLHGGLIAVRERLRGVVIERLPYADLISRYDAPGTLFYCDPPYWGSEDDYGKAIFPRSEFHRLAELLRAIEGRFILSINDTPEIRAIFDGLQRLEVETRYSIAGGGQSGDATRAKELVFSNFPIRLDRQSRLFDL